MECVRMEDGKAPNRFRRCTDYFANADAMRTPMMAISLIFILAFTAIIGIPRALALTDGMAEVTDVVVKPGEAAHFNIQLNYTATEPISSITYSLGTRYLPEDWIARIMYDGQEIRGLTIKNEQVLDIDLEIDVPETAGVGSYSFWFLAIGQELYTENIILQLQIDVDAIERGIEISCDHPSVGLDSDGVARYTLTIDNIGETDERLNLTGRALNDWEIQFEDLEGRAIYEAYLPTQVSMTIQIVATPPADVLLGAYGFSVGACSSDLVVNSTLDLKVVVSKVTEGVISALYPELSEEAGKALTFPITLKNVGTSSLVYRISTSLPSGWTASFRTAPGGTTSITSVTLDTKESTDLYLEVVTPNAVEVGTYTIPIQVVSDDGVTYGMDLKATIVGAYDMTIEPSTLLTSVVSGQSATFTVQVTNTGHTAISGVSVSTDVPTDWGSSLSPVSRDLLQPLESYTFTELVTTTSDTVAGDYLVTLTAISDQVNSDAVQVRITVTTPTSWGMWGFGVAIAMVIILAIVFLRLRRRLLALVGLIFVPIAASLMQLSISRGREYSADEEGARITRQPLSLATALEKIERAVKNGYTIKANPSTSPLWIANPFKGDGLMELFMTHPLTKKRVERLERLQREINRR